MTLSVPTMCLFTDLYLMVLPHPSHKQIFVISCVLCFQRQSFFTFIFLNPGHYYSLIFRNLCSGLWIKHAYKVMLTFHGRLLASCLF